MNNSFYGGRDGQAFIIKKSYDDIQAMLDVFKDFDNKTVNFGEYVILDYENKNHPLHGNVYRRGYDWSGSTEAFIFTYTWDTQTKTWSKGNTKAFGAVYIGNLKGAAGPTADIQIQKYSDINSINVGDEYSVLREGSGTIEIVDPEENPEKNNKIEWKSLVIRNEVTGQDTIAYVGFQVPYTKINITTRPASAYDNPSSTFTENENNPFIQSWEISIPRGIKGESISNIRIIESKSGEIYDFDNNPYEGDYPILAADIINYENRDPVTKTYFLGLYNSHLPVPTEIYIDSGKFYVKYSNGGEPSEIGNLDSIAPDLVVTSSSTNIDSTLRIGGIAIITEEV